MRNARPLAVVARIVSAVCLMLLGYGAAGLVGGALPANAGWRPPERGVAIWIEDNGVHTGLVMPKVAAGMDWRGLFPADDLRDRRYGGYDHVAVGWGDHDFYLGTPTWAELRPSTVLWAAIGSDRTLLHVEHVPRPIYGPEVRRVVLRPEEYRRLAAFVTESLRSRRRWPGYGANGVFYEARGRYSALYTCNNWTGAALRAAGVRIGRWTPFPASVMALLPAR